MRIFLGGLVLTVAAAALAAQTPPGPTDALQRTAQRLGSTVLAYQVSETETRVSVVGREGLVTSQLIPVPRAQLERLVSLTWPGPSITGDSRLPVPEPVPAALRYATLRGGEAVASTGQEAGAYRVLYELLIAPIRPALPGRDGLLTIVADGPLSALAFAPLGNENGRVLIEDYRLHYLSDASLEPAAPTPPNRGDRFLFVTSPPSGAREARAVIHAMRLIHATLLNGKGASPSAVRAAIPKARVLHLATDDVASMGLTATEVLKLQLTTDLVVVGASRVGGVIKYDPAMTLPRAFLSAGAHAVLASMWDINEDSRTLLITSFYEEWQKGGDKSRALRAAQLSLLRDLRAGKVKVNTPSGDMTLPPHSLLWANAILMGEP